MTIIYQLSKHGIISSNYAKTAYINYNKTFKADEYANKDKHTKSPRKYEQLVLRLYAQNIITQSRFNELMEVCTIDG